MRKIILLLFFCSALFAQSDKTEYSSGGKYRIEYKYDYSKGHHQIWVTDTSDSLKRSLLFGFERDAGVVFSPDDKNVIVNNRYGSDVSEILLFCKNEGGTFTQDKRNSITESAWKYFCVKNKIKKLSYHHKYVDCLSWSADSKYILIRLHGYENYRNCSDGWLCIYDIRNNSFSTDLMKINRNAVIK